MKPKDWIEKHFGRRPSSLPAAQARAKVKNLTALRAAAERACEKDAIWDARLEAVEAFMRSRNSNKE
jgi:hypothetical protein